MISGNQDAKDQMPIIHKYQGNIKSKEGDAIVLVVFNGDMKRKEIPKGQAKALAGSLHHYAEGKPENKNMRETTKRKVAVALAKEM